MALSITAASAVFLLGVESVADTQVQLQGFGVDDAFLTDVADVAETQVGVDGFGVAGYIPRTVMMTIRFLASANSTFLFEDWIAAQDKLQDILYANGLITYPTLKRKYTLYKGVLMRVNTMADVRRVLQNREFHISWLPNGVVPAISAAPL